MKYELNGAYKYTKIHVIELEIPRCSVRFLYNYLSIRKIGISCEVLTYILHLTKYIIYFTFHQSEYLLVSDTFNYTILILILITRLLIGHIQYTNTL
ncbi:hypothetical protein CN487_09725 [Bacillus cereus]|nr:hypothetical protein CN487_09725 [Bacillus cereus]